MNEVIDYNPQDFDVKIQPGVTRLQLNEYIKNEGLWFPIDPGRDTDLVNIMNPKYILHNMHWRDLDL